MQPRRIIRILWDNDGTTIRRAAFQLAEADWRIELGRFLFEIYLAGGFLRCVVVGSLVSCMFLPDFHLVRELPAVCYNFDFGCAPSIHFVNPESKLCVPSLKFDVVGNKLLNVG